MHHPRQVTEFASAPCLLRMNKPSPEAASRQEIHLLYPERAAKPLPWPDADGTSHSGGLPFANQGLRVEPFRNRYGHARVFAQFAPGTSPTVNGEPAPVSFVLAPGDVVHWLNDEGGFKVGLFNRPDIGPPPETLIGKPCPVCRVPLAKQSMCVRCACGAAMHCEPDGQDSLQCAQLRQACPVCNRQLTTQEGYLEETAD